VSSKGAIDGHAHIGPWKTPDFAGHQSTFAEAVRVYTDADFSGALVMGTDAVNNESLLTAILDHNESGLDPGFRFMAWVDPGHPGMMSFLDDNVVNIAALKIHPSFLRLRPDDDVLLDYWRWAVRTKRPVVVHCGRWQEMSSYRFCVEAAKRYPSIPVIAAHMGGDSPDLVQATIEGAKGVSNLFLGTESIRQPWLIQRAVDELGAHQIIFGSDYNLNSPRSFRCIIDDLTLDENQREAILGTNLNRLLPEALRF
jgi:predicted TIM-barrel fold metal-dependent hydrolase